MRLWNFFFSLMKIASWNVNSVRTRIDNILEWIKKENPDILCLQEIKVITDGFPREPFEDLGYNLIINGQKSYNGVATLSKFLIEVLSLFDLGKNNLRSNFSPGDSLRSAHTPFPGI